MWMYDATMKVELELTTKAKVEEREWLKSEAHHTIEAFQWLEQGSWSMNKVDIDIVILWTRAMIFDFLFSSCDFLGFWCLDFYN